MQVFYKRNLRHLSLWLVLPALCIASSNLFAGLSGENIIIVVNADSIRSRTIANHYVHLRKIPAGNVVFLSDVPDGLMASMDDFKDKILKPTLDTVNRRGLAKQARCIAYSADFPTSVDISSHTSRLPENGMKRIIGTRASITGLTYFYQFVLRDNHVYLSDKSNMYARSDFDQNFSSPFFNEKGKEFSDAQQQLKLEKYAEAAESFETLFKEYPTLAPLAIRAAQAHSKAGNREAALTMLKAAIKAGWWSATYLQDTPELKSLLNDPMLAKVIPYLSTHPTHVQGPRAFKSTAAWTKNGFPVTIENGGTPYMMSCSLAMLHTYGNTLGQAVTILQRAAKADRTYPKGQFRFAGGTDVRATTRFPGVADALLYLQDAGFETEVFPGAAPTKPGDIAGLMIGSANFSAKGTRWKLAPGSLSESLTSLGADFRNNGQTKLTVYLAAGAAMSSGAVMEPYALQHKFPLAMMYGYYASGVSAMEAYYLSVASPYQLLIVGDPVCQPFANPPADFVDATVVSTAPTQLRITRRPQKVNRKQTPSGRIEVYLNGRLTQEVPAVQNVNVNLPNATSGVVEVRAVLTGLAPTEPRISMVKEVDLNGSVAAPKATITQRRTASADPQDDGSKQGEIKVQLECPGADSIDLMLYTDAVGTVQGESGVLTIKTDKLGAGPLTFRPVAKLGKATVVGFSVSDGDY